MDANVAWNVLLLIGKWAFIGLIYAVLFVILAAVRRELKMRLRPAALGAGPGSPLPAAAPGRLHVLDGGSDDQTAPGAVFSLPAEFHLGADSAALGPNDLVLGDQYVSGRHARMRWDGVKWWIEDLDSKNGTFVNDQRCRPFVAHPVPPGAKLRLGDVVLELL